MGGQVVLAVTSPQIACPPLSVHQQTLNEDDGIFPVCEKADVPTPADKSELGLISPH